MSLLSWTQTYYWLEEPQLPWHRDQICRIRYMNQPLSPKDFEDSMYSMKAGMTMMPPMEPMSQPKSMPPKQASLCVSELSDLGYLDDSGTRWTTYQNMPT